MFAYEFQFVFEFVYEVQFFFFFALELGFFLFGDRLLRKTVVKGGGDIPLGVLAV